MSRWVANTSPLIFLAKLDRLDLLRKAADEILVPGELASLKQEIDRLHREGFRVSPALVEAVLREAGEVGQE